MASSPSARRRRLQYLSPTETLEIGGGGLSLSPRVKLLLTFFRSDPAVKPIDEWKLKLALLDFLRSHPLSLSVPDDDLVIRRRPDLHKRKRDEPVASGTLFVRDLGFLKSENREGGEEDEGASRKRFLDWRSTFVDRLAGIDLNLEGVKFKMTVEIPPADDFELMKKSWEDYYTSQLLDSRNYILSLILERGSFSCLLSCRVAWLGKLEILICTLCLQEGHLPGDQTQSLFGVFLLAGLRSHECRPRPRCWLLIPFFPHWGR